MAEISLTVIQQFYYIYFFSFNNDACRSSRFRWRHHFEQLINARLLSLSKVVLFEEENTSENQRQHRCVFLIASSTPTFFTRSYNLVPLIALLLLLYDVILRSYNFLHSHINWHPADFALALFLEIARSRFYSAFREAFLQCSGIMSFTVGSRGEASFLQMTAANFNILLQCPLTLPENDCSHYIADCRLLVF